MKRILASAITAAIAVPAALAATSESTFDVSVALTSQCTATNSGTTTLDFGTYTAFQTTAATATPVSLTFSCTRGFAPSDVAFDSTNGTTGGVGVLTGLQYSLTAGTPSIVDGTAASTTSTGSGDIITYAVSGTMPANQAGDCNLATCGPASHVRTLIVTY